MQRTEPFRLSGPDTVDGECYRRWMASRLGRAEETPREIRLGHANVMRTWLLTAYPEGPAEIGQLNRLLRFHLGDPEHHQVQVRLTFHIRPAELPEGRSTDWLRNRQAGVAAETQARGLPDADTTKALKAYGALHEAVKFHRDGVFELWVAVTAVAPTAEILNRIEQNLTQLARKLRITFAPLYKEQVDGLALTNVLGQHPERLLRAWPSHVTYGRALAHHYPFGSGSISDGRGVYIGHETDNLGFARAAHVDFTQGVGPMTWVVAGMAGEGKSTAIKAWIVGLLLEGFRVFVYDANDEYEALTRAVDGVHVDLASAAGRYFEPLVIPPPSGDPGYDRNRLTQTSQLFHAVLRGLVVDLTPEEKAVAERVLLRTWQNAGVDPERPDTWSRRAGIHDWYRILSESGIPAAETLKSRLYPYFEGTQQAFREAVEPDWGDARLVRIALGIVANNQVEHDPLAAVKMMLVNHRVWNAIVETKHRGRQYTMVFMDEANRVAPIPEMTAHTYQLATDSRKFNAGFCMIGNDVHSFFETRGGRGLWENASLHVLFHMHDSGLQKAAANAQIPPAVVSELRQMSGTHEFMVSRNLSQWARARLRLPEAELELYRTRGLKGGGRP